MSHEIDFSKGAPAMAYRGEVPWHGLGASMDENATVDEWIKAAGLDYTIKRGFVRYATSRDGANDPSSYGTMQDRVVLFRDDTQAPLGVVSDNYKVVQPRAVLEFFRETAEANHGVIETAGALFGGAKYWALVRLTNDMAVRGSDVVRGYLMLSTSADGTSATEGRRTMVRVVCANTLAIAERGRASVRVTHKSVFDPHAAKITLGIAHDEAMGEFARTTDQFRALASMPVSREEIITLTLRAFGHKPEEMTRREIEEAGSKAALRNVATLATGSGLIGRDLDGGQGTVWAWLNGVTQYVDHAARARSQDNRLDSAWFGRGDSLKSTAFDVALRFADLVPA